MSAGHDTRFAKGRSGNPAGRPKARRPHVSAFEIIFDKVLTVMQGGKTRKLTVDEALQLQIYQTALKGNKMAVRQVLKMIAKREVTLAKKNPPRSDPITLAREYSADNANAAMTILGIVEPDPAWGDEHPRLKIASWATQAALSRPGRNTSTARATDSIKTFTMEPDDLRWPRSREA